MKRTALTRVVARRGSTPTGFQKSENYAWRYSLLKNNGPVTNHLFQNERGSLQLIPCPLANTLLLEEPSPDKLLFYGYLWTKIWVGSGVEPSRCVTATAHFALWQSAAQKA